MPSTAQIVLYICHLSCHQGVGMWCLSLGERGCTGVGVYTGVSTGEWALSGSLCHLWVPYSHPRTLEMVVRTMGTASELGAACLCDIECSNHSIAQATSTSTTTTTVGAATHTPTLYYLQGDHLWMGHHTLARLSPYSIPHRNHRHSQDQESEGSVSHCLGWRKWKWMKSIICFFTGWE